MTTDQQDGIVKQLEDRYDRIVGTPRADGSLAVVASGGAERVGRVIIVAQSGRVLYDSADG